MKMIISVFCFFIMVSHVYAETESEKRNLTDSMHEGTPSGLKESNKKQNTSQSTLQKKENKKNRKKWPPTIYPSEKINADSSVSFPVDI